MIRTPSRRNNGTRYLGGVLLRRKSATTATTTTATTAKDYSTTYKQRNFHTHERVDRPVGSPAHSKEYTHLDKEARPRRGERKMMLSFLLAAALVSAGDVVMGKSHNHRLIPNGMLFVSPGKDVKLPVFLAWHLFLRLCAQR